MSFIRSVRTSNMKKIMGLLIAGVVLAMAESAHAALIISQYYEGVSNDRFIEIFNTGPSSVDLGAADIRLGIWNNSNREAWKTSGSQNASVTLTGSVAPNSTYLIRNSSAATPAYAVTGANLINGVVPVFTGDDSLVLYSGSTFAYANVIDAFGVAGTNTYADASYVRNPSVTLGTNADFNAAQWTVYSNAAVGSASSTSNEYLGFHSVTAVPEPSTIALAGFGLIGLGVAYRRRRLA